MTSPFIGEKVQTTLSHTSLWDASLPHGMLLIYHPILHPLVHFGTTYFNTGPLETSSVHQGRALTPLPKVLKPVSQSGTLDAVHPRAIAI